MDITPAPSSSEPWDENTEWNLIALRKQPPPQLRTPQQMQIHYTIMRQRQAVIAHQQRVEAENACRAEEARVWLAAAAEEDVRDAFRGQFREVESGVKRRGKAGEEEKEEGEEEKSEGKEGSERDDSAATAEHEHVSSKSSEHSEGIEGDDPAVASDRESSKGNNPRISILVTNSEEGFSNRTTASLVLSLDSKGSSVSTGCDSTLSLHHEESLTGSDGDTLVTIVNKSRDLGIAAEKIDDDDHEDENPVIQKDENVIMQGNNRCSPSEYKSN